LRDKNQFFGDGGKKYKKISPGAQSRYLAPGAGVRAATDSMHRTYSRVHSALVVVDSKVRPT